MRKNNQFMVSAYQIFKLVDIELLDESLNGGDREYAGVVIDLLMMAHQKVYGDVALPEEGENTVIHPAIILDEDSGRERLGLAKCIVIPFPEDLPLFELLKGRLLKIEAMQMPAEYETLSYYAEEAPVEERNLTISVIVGKNCLMQCYGAISKEDDEELETEEDAIGLTQ